MPNNSRKRAELSTEIDKNKVLELFVCQYSVEEIAEELKCSSSYVQTVLDNSIADFYARNQSYAEKAALMNMAKLQALTKTWMPKAIDGSMQAAQFMLKVIKLENEMTNGLDGRRQQDSTIEHVVRYEQTFTSSDERYRIAQENLENQWLDKDYNEDEYLEMLKADDIPFIMDGATQHLAELHAQYPELAAIDELEDDNDG